MMIILYLFFRYKKNQYIFSMMRRPDGYLLGTQDIDRNTNEEKNATA
jgi:hypothetical protein